MTGYICGDLTEEQGKYCRCVLHVAAKNDEDCNRSKDWGSSKKPSKCYNPYAVCAKTVGTTTKCGDNYIWENIPVEEVEAFAYLKGIKLTGEETPEELINKIGQWKKDKY